MLSRQKIFILGATAAVAGGGACGLTLLLGDRPEARRLAALHRAADPAASGRAARLLETLHDRADAARFLVDQRPMDLAAGRMTVLDGWVMPLCEADLLLAVASA